MSITNIRRALMQGIEESPFGTLPYAQDNTKFDRPKNSPWGIVTILPADVRVATLGSEGQDSHAGIMQLDLNWPLLTGDGPIRTKADAVAGFFYAGKRLVYAGTEVKIDRPSRASRGREVEGWYRVTVTVPWESRVNRIV